MIRIIGDPMMRNGAAIIHSIVMNKARRGPLSHGAYFSSHIAACMADVFWVAAVVGSVIVPM